KKKAIGACQETSPPRRPQGLYRDSHAMLTPRMASDRPFKLVSEYEPRGDQPKAIKELVDAIKRGDKHQTLLGITGSGKTYTAACVIEAVQRPTLIMAHNKTLAAQLYG